MEGRVTAGGKGKILRSSSLSAWKAIQTIFRDVTVWDIMIFSFFFWELHHSWTSWHPSFTDSQIQVNKEFFATDYTGVHWPFPFSLLPPSSFTLLHPQDYPEVKAGFLSPVTPTSSASVTALLTSGLLVGQGLLSRPCHCSCGSPWLAFVSFPTHQEFSLELLPVIPKYLVSSTHAYQLLDEKLNIRQACNHRTHK